MPATPQESAVEVIRQLVTQIITLCTSLIAAGVAFAKIGSPPPQTHCFIFLALVGFGLAIGLGIGALMAVTSVLANGSFNVANGLLVRVFAGLQIISFMCGLFFLVLLARQLL